MKVFIDLGSYNGATTESAYKEFPDFDMFIGFDPIPHLARKRKIRVISEKIIQKRCAAGTENKDNVKFYISPRHSNGEEIAGVGSTLFVDKTTGDIDKNKFIGVKVIDFSEYLDKHFKRDDYIILKVNIEGSEYDLLEHLIKTGNISFINKLYCSWHFDKIDGISQERHDKLIEKLNELGFNLIGKSSEDGFAQMISRKKLEDELKNEG